MATGIQEIDALHRDVTDLKVSVAGMKPYVEQIPGIADSLKILAEIMPRLQTNMEDHQHIHKRLDYNDNETKKVEARLHVVEICHAACMERQRIEAVEEQESFATIAKRVIIPAIVSAALGFAGWMMAEHLPAYIGNKVLPPTEVTTK